MQSTKLKGINWSGLALLLTCLMLQFQAHYFLNLSHFSYLDSGIMNDISKFADNVISWQLFRSYSEAADVLRDINILYEQSSVNDAIRCQQMQCPRCRRK